ncbi:MAG: PIN domain-containing protein [Chitinivibrionales bacterium]|nr:PIN domain-containing protein [Chitinivibrionales bacterium]
MSKVLLDTNAYSRLMAGDQSVFEQIANADIVYMSTFVVGELLFGFKGGNKERDNKKILDKFLTRSTVKILNATFDTAVFFAQVKQSLKLAGAPIPINDIWIAAHALETGSVMVSYDNHFDNVPGLRMWDAENLGTE